MCSFPNTFRYNSFVFLCSFLFKPFFLVYTKPRPLAWRRQFCMGQWRSKKERKTEEKMRRQHQGLDRNGVKESGRRGKMEMYCCTVVCRSRRPPSLSDWDEIMTPPWVLLWFIHIQFIQSAWMTYNSSVHQNIWCQSRAVKGKGSETVKA